MFYASCKQKPVMGDHLSTKNFWYNEKLIPQALLCTWAPLGSGLQPWLSPRQCSHSLWGTRGGLRANVSIPDTCVSAVTTLQVDVYLAPYLRVKEVRIAHSSLLCSGKRFGKAVNLGLHGGWSVARLWFTESLTIVCGELAGLMLTVPLHCSQPLNCSHKNQELHKVHCYHHGFSDFSHNEDKFCEDYGKHPGDLRSWSKLGMKLWTKVWKIWKLACSCSWLMGQNVTSLGESGSCLPEVGDGGFVKTILSKAIYRNIFLR